MTVHGPETEEADGRPLHERIAADLRDDILSGDLAPGDSLPSTAQLKERFGAANATVQKALQLLKGEHLVVGRAGASVTVREHRQRTIRPAAHIAALGAAGLDPVESLVSFAGVGAARPEVFASRGWGEEEWGAARGRLQERGLLAADGTATGAGRELRAKVELRTDEEAAEPWRALGEEGRVRLAELLGEPWLETIGSGLLPGENTLGIGKV